MLSVINKISQNSSAGLGNNRLSLAIIVPILNEVKQLPELVKQLESIGAQRLILVDGGSADGSIEWLKRNWASEKNILCQSRAGRAKQMNAGAELAEQDMLLFLHADTVLPIDAKKTVCFSGTLEQHWGRFDVTFDSQSLMMSLIAFFMNWRSRLTKVATGDQAIFMHRSLFNQVAGFDDIELMEDVAMSKKLRKLSSPLSSNSKVITSARRWRSNGVMKTILKMWCYRFAYFLGVSPNRLAKGYRDVR